MDDFFDLDDPNIRGGEELEVKVKYEDDIIAEARGNQSNEEFLASLELTTVKLRGDRTAGRHQELMAESTQGVNIRISRNNASDTFQVGAQADGERQLPELKTVTPETRLTGAQLLQAFREQHDFWQRYEQADCQQFAKAIMEKVSGEASSDGDDDFM